jgi:hypothetical protein
VSKGDRISVKNLTWSTAATGAAVSQLAELLPHLQSDAGLLVVDTGVIVGSGPGAEFYSGIITSGITNSYNKQGYANAVLVRGKFTDPTLTGGLSPVSLGGIPDVYANADSLSKYLVTNTLSTGRLLNQSHQVQVAMRVITRELDSTGVLRPDNL